MKQEFDSLQLRTILQPLSIQNKCLLPIFVVDDFKRILRQYFCKYIVVYIFLLAFG